MPLVRTYARIDEGGRLSLPSNIKTFGGFVDGEVVELKLVGPKGRILISKKEPRKVGLEKMGVKKIAVH
ncbi:MAG: hypothetical protein Q6354_09810 [Candidatus Brocadiales bacterium]|nr:hypothetical protein [Candidatus Brocadiales bacterium]